VKAWHVAVLWLALSAAWAAAGWKRHYGELYDGAMTDHASHVSRTRAFLRVGPALWTTPAGELPAFPDSHVNWPELPAMYPPGMLLLHAPFAALVEAGVVTTERVSFFVIVAWLLAFAAVCGMLSRLPAKTLVDRAFLALLALGLLGFVVRGFYDVVPMLVLLHAFAQATRGKTAQGLAWWALAAFLHYRVFFTAPLVVPWLVELVRARAWGWLAVSASLLLPSLATFAMSARFLSVLPETNPMHHVWPAVLVLLALAAWLTWCAKRGLLRDAAPLALVVLMLMVPRQTMSWHVFVIWPAFLSWREEPAVERWARQLLAVVVMFVGLRGEWPGHWLSHL
jgi:hypothetical protein